MQAPKYPPKQWVVYNIGNGAGFGVITGGMLNKGSWMYFIKGQNSDGSTLSIMEDAIVYEFNGGDWVSAKPL